MKVYPSIKDIEDMIDTVTVYVSADVSSAIGADILSKKPWRIIFNPGAENAVLESQARDRGIKPINGCTLVMLKTGKF